MKFKGGMHAVTDAAKGSMHAVTDAAKTVTDATKEGAKRTANIAAPGPRVHPKTRIHTRALHKRGARASLKTLSLNDDVLKSSRNETYNVMALLQRATRCTKPRGRKTEHATQTENHCDSRRRFELTQ